MLTCNMSMSLGGQSLLRIAASYLSTVDVRWGSRVTSIVMSIGDA